MSNEIEILTKEIEETKSNNKIISIKLGETEIV